MPDVEATHVRTIENAALHASQRQCATSPPSCVPYKVMEYEPSNQVATPGRSYQAVPNFVVVEKGDLPPTSNYVGSLWSNDRSTITSPSR